MIGCLQHLEVDISICHLQSFTISYDIIHTGFLDLFKQGITDILRSLVIFLFETVSPKQFRNALRDEQYQFHIRNRLQ